MDRGNTLLKYDQILWYIVVEILIFLFWMKFVHVAMVKITLICLMSNEFLDTYMPATQKARQTHKQLHSPYLISNHGNKCWAFVGNLSSASHLNLYYSTEARRKTHQDIIIWSYHLHTWNSNYCNVLDPLPNNTFIVWDFKLQIYYSFLHFCALNVECEKIPCLQYQIAGISPCQLYIDKTVDIQIIGICTTERFSNPFFPCCLVAYIVLEKKSNLNISKSWPFFILFFYL